MNIKHREKAKTVKQLLRLSDEDFAKLTVIDAPAFDIQQTQTALYSNPECRWGDPPLPTPTRDWQNLPFADKEGMNFRNLVGQKDIFKFKKEICG